MMEKYYRDKRDVSNASSGVPIRTTLTSAKTLLSVDMEKEYGSSHTENNEKEEYKIVKRKKIDGNIDAGYNGPRVSVLVHNISLINDTGQGYDSDDSNTTR